MFNKLQEFFAVEPVMDNREFHHFTLVEEGSGTLIVSVSEYQDLKVTWEQNGKSMMDIKNIAISDSVLIDDGFEKSVQFVLERMPSRMIKVQVEPSLHVEFGLYWESCDDECDEEDNLSEE
jgi:hypothetical protein